MRREMRLFSLISALLLIPLNLANVKAMPTQAELSSRPFYMGFTPFPYDISLEAVLFSYTALTNHADIVMQHFDNGVPWTEALANTPYHPAMEQDLELHRRLTPKGLPILLSITPIAFSRDGLAAYRGEQGDMLIPAPFDRYPFNHPEVKQAYLNYCRRMIAHFQPAYLNIGIEANLLMEKAPDQWPAYVELHRYIYTELKRDHPALIIFASFQAQALLADQRPEVDHAAQLKAVADLHDYIDVFAISSYPYGSRYMTQTLPTTMFDQLAALTDKPLAIAETGYPAQDVRFEALGLTMKTDDKKQQAFIEWTLQQAAKHHMLFVINFVIRDYDALAAKIGGGDLVNMWRDTGLFAEDGRERPALAVWDNILALPYHP